MDVIIEPMAGGTGFGSSAAVRKHRPPAPVSSMLLAGLIKCSLIDYPGRVAATVFTQGCNLRCAYCHNQTLISMRPPVSGHSIQQEGFFHFLEGRRGRLDGVCVTGGEPTQHPDLDAFLHRIKELGFLVKLDTNGSRPGRIAELLDQEVIDFIAMDVKNRLETKHYKASCGQFLSMRSLRESISLIRGSGKPYEFRTTVVPGEHRKGDLLAIARELVGAKRYALQHFRPSPDLPDSLNQRSGEVGPIIEEARPQIEEWVEELVVR